MDVQGATPSAATLPPAGTLVGGKYRIDGYIAEGGMGVIARGHHVELDEPVALKFLKPDIVAEDASGTVAGRFVREARSTIKIKSEHVPRIFDVSTLPSGIPYIVMELLEGEDLDQRVEKQGRLPVVFVIDMLLQSLEALAAAHSLGMVHRDFKPANLFLTKSADGGDWVKVLDFGIAKLVDQNGTGDQGLTGTNAVMGSPRYMAPEQMRASRDVDARADVWAVGTTTYELLAGVPAFNGESLTHVCASILQDEPEALAKHRSDVPAALEAVLHRCLAKSASDRYPNVAELAAALAPFGTAPTADESARRIARVLGAPATSDPMLTIAGSLPPRPSAGVSAPGGQTTTSWGSIQPTTSNRRPVWMLAVALGVLLAGGGVVGGTFLARPRQATGGSSASAPPPPSIVPAAETAPKASAAPEIPSVPPVASSAPPPTPTTVAPTAKPKSPVEPKPIPAPAAEPKPPPKPAPKPTAAPTGGGLWDDRK